MFDKHRAATQIAGDPYIQISAARGYADGETIPVADTDWSGESLACVVSKGPDQPSLATLSVSLSTESKTWQQYKDECVPVERYMPCGAELTDSITTTLMTISWSAANLASLPRATVLGEPVNLYLEVRRSNGTGQRFAAGDFILTERVT